MGVAGKPSVGAAHVPAEVEELGAVGIGVFDRVGVEVLVDRLAPVVAAAHRVGLDRPGALHPGTLVDLVNVVVAVHAAGGPEEAVEPPDLVEQLAQLRLIVGRAGGRVRVRRLRAQSIGPHGDDVADLARLDPILQLPSGPGNGGSSGRRPP